MRRTRLAHPDDALRRLARGAKAPLGGASSGRGRREPDSPRSWWLLSVLGAVAFVCGIAALPLFAHREKIFVTGLADHAFITKDQLGKNLVEIRIVPSAQTHGATLRIDGTPLRVLEQGTTLRWLAPSLQDGEHRLTVRSGKRFLWRAASTKVVHFTVDSVAPLIEIERSSQPVRLTGPYTLRGKVELGSTVVIDGKPAPTKDGHFSRRYPYPPVGQIDVVAIDQAGNQSAASQPRQIEYPVIRGVHMSAESWVSPGLKQAVFHLADAKRINTVELDLKDDNGMVLYNSALAQVASMHSGVNLYDLRDAVAALHARGVRVMGRIVVFRDPLMVTSALASGRPEDVVLGGDGGAYQSQEGVFSNPFSNRVHDYNVAIAREAADFGIDDILFDYVSRPIGNIADMRFTGSFGDTNEAIDRAMVTFLRKASRSLSGTPTRIGVSVFGVAARFPHSIGQNVRSLAPVVDYIAPIVFPSKFRAGSYAISSPSLNPATIVERALAQFNEQVSGSGAVLLPWLQDFSVGSFRYGPRELQAQIAAAQALGIQGFLVWDPKVTYSAAGFAADALPIEVVNRSAASANSSGPEPTAATIAPTTTEHVPDFATTTIIATGVALPGPPGAHPARTS
jgi:hypothetical protein